MQCILRRATQEPELCTLSILIGVVAIMVLMDRASNDDSNGGHIVIWSNFDLCNEIPAVSWILTLLSTF